CARKERKGNVAQDHPLWRYDLGNAIHCVDELGHSHPQTQEKDTNDTEPPRTFLAEGSSWGHCVRVQGLPRRRGCQECPHPADAHVFFRCYEARFRTGRFLGVLAPLLTMSSSDARPFCWCRA